MLLLHNTCCSSAAQSVLLLLGYYSPHNDSTFVPSPAVHSPRGHGTIVGSLAGMFLTSTDCLAVPPGHTCFWGHFAVALTMPPTTEVANKPGNTSAQERKEQTATQTRVALRFCGQPPTTEVANKTGNTSAQGRKDKNRNTDKGSLEVLRTAANHRSGKQARQDVCAEGLDKRNHDTDKGSLEVLRGQSAGGHSEFTQEETAHHHCQVRSVCRQPAGESKVAQQQHSTAQHSPTATTLPRQQRLSHSPLCCTACPLTGLPAIKWP